MCLIRSERCARRDRGGMEHQRQTDTTPPFGIRPFPMSGSAKKLSIAVRLGHSYHTPALPPCDHLASRLLRQTRFQVSPYHNPRALRVVTICSNVVVLSVSRKQHFGGCYVLLYIEPPVPVRQWLFTDGTQTSSANGAGRVKPSTPRKQTPTRNPPSTPFHFYYRLEWLLRHGSPRDRGARQSFLPSVAVGWVVGVCSGSASLSASANTRILLPFLPVGRSGGPARGEIRPVRSFSARVTAIPDGTSRRVAKLPVSVCGLSRRSFAHSFTVPRTSAPGKERTEVERSHSTATIRRSATLAEMIYVPGMQIQLQRALDGPAIDSSVSSRRVPALQL